MTRSRSEPLLRISGLPPAMAGRRSCAASNLDVMPGEIVAVLGANGVGKTTLNKTLSGVIRARAGEIHFGGQRIDGLAPPAIVELGLIQVPEGRKIFPDMSVRENLELGSYRRGKPNRARNLERVFDTLPAPAGAHPAGRRHALGRRAADARHRARPDGGAAPAHPRRAVAGPLAAAGRGDVRAGLAAQRATGSPSCWSSRTSCSRWRSPPARYVLENGRFVLSGAARRSSRNPDAGKSLSGDVTMHEPDQSPHARRSMSLRRASRRSRIVIAPGVYDALTASLASGGRLRGALSLRRGHRLYAARPPRYRPRLHDRSRRDHRPRSATGSPRRSSSMPIPATATRSTCSAPCGCSSARAPAAIQLEDQSFPKRCGHLADKRLIAAGEMAGKIKAAVDARASAETLDHRPHRRRRRRRLRAAPSSGPSRYRRGRRRRAVRRGAAAPRRSLPTSSPAARRHARR